MNKDIKLYIKNKRVDLSGNIAFPFQYQFEDTNNPSIIKNNFSKTITIEGTKNNNKIFGEIFNLDRKQEWGDSLVNVNFNPLQRTDFALYRNNTIIESGYMQLNSVVKKNGKLQYKITLYGGLGDFFYNLMYTESGEERTLANLDYGIEDLDFNINKEFVHDAWQSLKSGSTSGTIYDLLTFVPAYNGIPDTINSEKVIVNTFESPIYSGITTTNDEKTYLPNYTGYMVGEMSREYNEWEMQDLRSFNQRPAIKLKKVFEAICDKKNNGGYDVELDSSFFNDTNKYYNNAYITLPMLSELELSKDGAIKNLDMYETFKSQHPAGTVITNDSFSSVSNTYNQVLSATDSELGIGWIEDTEAFGGHTSLGVVAQGGKVRLEASAKIRFTPDVNIPTNPENLYLSYRNSRGSATYWNVLQAYLVVYKPGVWFDPIAMSIPLNLSNGINKMGLNYVFPSSPSIWMEGGSPTPFSKGVEGATDVDGRFVRQDDGSYLFVDGNGNDTFHFLIPELTNNQEVNIALSLDWYTNNNANYKLLQQKIMDGDVINNFQKSGGITIEMTNAKMTTTMNSDNVVTNQFIPMEKWLKTDYSPADVLLDYSKIFGLSFMKDVDKKKITILTRNNFFQDNVTNLQTRIDYSKDFTITPTLCDNKFLLMKYSDSSTFATDKYKKDYALTYGQKRIDTNYNFNQSTKEMYSDIKFQGCTSILDTSACYRSFYANDGSGIYPPFEIEGCDYTLYQNGDNLEDTLEYRITQLPQITAVDWNKVSGKDIFPKMCYFSTDNSLSDVTSSLVFFNGFVETKNKDGGQVPFWLTDNLQEMFRLAEESCYLYTYSEKNKFGQQIAIKQTELPQFTRYDINNAQNAVIASWDFAVPKETYFGDVRYDENSTIYNRFWERYFTDRYDVNTKKVECYVNLIGIDVTQQNLRQFYWFENCYWVLNKIINYDPCSTETTKCEFIKVNNIANYTVGQNLWFLPKEAEQKQAEAVKVKFMDS